jgi:hypothetical protein
VTSLVCKICKKIIIEDLEEYLEKYPDEEKVKCCYCWREVKIR